MYRRYWISLIHYLWPMHRKISADIIYPVAGPPVKNGVVVLNEYGEVQEISAREKFDGAELEIYRGAIVPGFINTHCHLELSHLKGIAPTGTGLINFISHIIQNRNHPMDVIL